MVTIAQSQMLLRRRTELPDGLRLATEEFREGWSLVRSASALRFGKQFMAHGWNFVMIADGLLRSGVGDTSHEAVGNALKLALRHISERINAAEVEHIELTQYPWFFLARVMVVPYQIQPRAALLMPEESRAIPSPRRQRRLHIDPEVLYPHFGSAMPQLKRLLT
ncbi:MAG: hypothetical protein WBQ94_01545 [Terracidiphilus sp.]